MRYTVTKQVVEVLGTIWMPAMECGQRLELSAYDMANLGNPRNRNDVERWVMLHSGDFQHVTDFRADFHVETCTRCGANSTDAPSGKGKRTCKAGHDWRTSHIVHEWTRGEESEMAYNDAMYGHIDAED